MGIAEAIAAFLDGLPFVRGLWRRLRERRMEVEFHSPNSNLPSFNPRVEADDPITTVGVHPANPHIYAWLNLTIVNHRTDRPERIQNIELHLKKRRLLFWRSTIATADVVEHFYSAGSRDFQSVPLHDWLVDPLSARQTKSVMAEAKIPIHPKSLPRKMWLVLHFKMVGSMRHMDRTLREATHDPKNVPDADD